MSRLLEAAKEFNIGRATIIEFLWENGFEINGDQNQKLSEEMYKAVQIKFEQFKSDNLLKQNNSQEKLNNQWIENCRKLENPHFIIEEKRKLEQKRIKLEKQKGRNLKEQEPPPPKLFPSPFNERA